ncbi:hypothetical protein ABK040_010801 [Willaertia magna]
MDGFGASLTDASCWLLKNKLSDQKRSEIMNDLFGPNGINISLLRQPMGSCDFAWESWSFDDSQSDDFSLQNFSLWREEAYIRPMLNQALQVNKGRIKIFATPWSPPAWMKSGRNLFGSAGGYLRPECYDVYADYFVKYIQQNEKLGSPIYAVTPQNEPQYAPSNYPGMLMSIQDEIGFIGDYLGPKFEKAGIKTKIVCFDHDFDDNNTNYAVNVLSNPRAYKYCSGSAFHPYDTAVGPDKMTRVHNTFPDKELWLTEAGSGTWIGDDAAQFSNQMYLAINCPRNWAKSVIFWNIALDQNASPKLSGVDTTNTNRGFLTIRSDTMNVITKNTSYYSMGHSSKFVDPNAYRIQSNSFDGDIENVAYINPDGSKVIVLSNRTYSRRKIKVKWGSQSFNCDVPGMAALTFKWGTSGPTRKIISIKSCSNNRFVSADNYGDSPLIANRTSVSQWEQFELIYTGINTVSLRALVNNKYVSADNYGNNPLIANRDSIGEWESFQIITTSDNKIVLKALVNGKYVSSNDGTIPLIANRDTYALWETFEFQ